MRNIKNWKSFNESNKKIELKTTNGIKRFLKIGDEVKYDGGVGIIVEDEDGDLCISDGLEEWDIFGDEIIIEK